MHFGSVQFSIIKGKNKQSTIYANTASVFKLALVSPILRRPFVAPMEMAQVSLPLRRPFVASAGVRGWCRGSFVVRRAGSGVRGRCRGGFVVLRTVLQ